ncbi:unnamed protein product [Prunus armeniaca]
MMIRPDPNHFEIFIEPYEYCWIRTGFDADSKVEFGSGSYDALMLSKESIKLNVPFLSATIYYWNITSNTFDFGLWPRTPAILDVASLFEFHPHGVNIDVLGDYERNRRKVKTWI